MNLVKATTLFILFANSECAAKETKQSTKRKTQEICETLGVKPPLFDSTCWDFNSPAEFGQQKGCDHSECEAAVCNCDAYCCNDSWDLSCRGYNNGDPSQLMDNPFTPGCSSSILCCEDQVNDNRVVCLDKTSMGYDNLNSLNEDIARDNDLAESGVAVNPMYIICPGVTFNMALDPTQDGIIPRLPNTVIQCGKDGSSANQCILSGGVSHITLASEITATNVQFKGLTMTGSTKFSLRAWSPAPSSAMFMDCHWKGNLGENIIDVYNEGNVRRMLSHHERGLQVETEATMRIKFDNCTFTENEASVGVLLLYGGNVEIKNGKIDSNNVEAVTLGLAGGTSLTMDSSQFTNNESGFATVYKDNASTLMGTGNTGSGNTAPKCNGIFFEESDGACLETGGFTDACIGVCCEFGDTACYI